MKVDRSRATAPILVTGASSGLGLALTAALIRQGSAVIVAARIEAQVERLVRRFKLNAADGIILDFASPDYRAAAVRISQLPSLRGMVHCASMYAGPLAELTEPELASWGNFYGCTLALAQASLVRLQSSGGGRLIFVGSIVGSPGRIGRAGPYALYKGWLRLLAEEVSIEGHRHSVSCTYLNLGSFRARAIASAAPSQYLDRRCVVDRYCV